MVWFHIDTNHIINWLQKKNKKIRTCCCGGRHCQRLRRRQSRLRKLLISGCVDEEWWKGRSDADCWVEACVFECFLLGSKGTKGTMAFLFGSATIFNWTESVDWSVIADRVSQFGALPNSLTGPNQPKLVDRTQSAHYQTTPNFFLVVFFSYNFCFFCKMTTWFGNADSNHINYSLNGYKILTC